MKIKGKYNTAAVFTDILEETAQKQIEELCNQPFTENLQIAIMPDAHAGAGCTIGTTMTIADKVVPNLVGVDIGCGVISYPLTAKDIDFNKVDQAIKKHIPVGFNLRKKVSRVAEAENIENQLMELDCGLFNSTTSHRFLHSIGTLGSGNHFIEINKDDEGYLWLSVHSGSRNLGLQVAQHYQRLAGTSTGLEYLDGELCKSYLKDAMICQKYAACNRRAIAWELMTALDLLDKCNVDRVISTIHNYIGDDYILRKGAVSAHKDELFLLPMNMRDGIYVCKGKGNPNWNFSAPHGAGRLLSRGAAKRQLSLEEFKSTMAGIHSVTVNKDTLDEAPASYKNSEVILSQIQDTAEIIGKLSTVYNYKGV